MWFDRLFDGFSGMSEYDKERAKEREFLKVVIASANSICAAPWQKCPLSSDTHTKYEATTGRISDIYACTLEESHATTVGRDLRHLVAQTCARGSVTDPLHERPVAVPAELKDPTSGWKLPTRIRVHSYDIRTVGLVQNNGRPSDPLPGPDTRLVSRSCETVRSGSKGCGTVSRTQLPGPARALPAPAMRGGLCSAIARSGLIGKTSHEPLLPVSPRAS